MDQRSRHQKKVCGHCSEYLSYSAYQFHKAKFYIETEQRWVSKDEYVQNEENSDHDTETIMDFDWETSEHNISETYYYLCTYCIYMLVGDDKSKLLTIVLLQDTKTLKM